MRLRWLPLGICIIAVSLSGCIHKAGDKVTFQGVSMLPSIKDGEKLSIKRFEREGIVEVQRGDIVVFLYPGDTSKFYIKRVIGLPHDSVEIREGAVFINGSKLEEPYVDQELNHMLKRQPPVTVTDHAYYVLGDNRDNSSDSRMWGLVPEKNILAKVINR